MLAWINVVRSLFSCKKKYLWWNDWNFCLVTTQEPNERIFSYCTVTFPKSSAKKSTKSAFILFSIYRNEEREEKLCNNVCLQQFKLKSYSIACQRHRIENVNQEKKLPPNLHTTKYLCKVCSGLEAMSTKINELQIYQSLNVDWTNAFGMQDRFKRDKIRDPESTRSNLLCLTIALH